MTELTTLSQIVAVGSSSTETLLLFVATLPKDLTAPLVISHSFEALRTDHILEQVRGRSSLPVHLVRDHAKMEAGTIYIVPSDRGITFDGDRLNAAPTTDGHFSSSIQLLFEAATQVYGDQLIAVILAGVGSESATSALGVKRGGGTVIIQNPRSNAYMSIPRSLPPTSVDFIVDLEEIGTVIHDLLDGTQQLIGGGETRSLQTFLRHLHDRSGLDFTSYKTPTIQRRLQRRMVATGSPSLAAYMRYLQGHPDEYSRLISTLLIKVTEFFRDRELYTELREHILPSIIANARQNGNEMRLWSAGCATGEEAYSLAILIAELLGEELEQFRVRIFATDLDNDAIAYARRGIYPPGALAGMPQDLVTRYFVRTDSEYEVQKAIRGVVIFGVHDLGQRAPFPRIDLVLCRNVLIYFTVELQKRVLQLFAYSLRDGGYLVLGKAETTSPLSEFFATVQPSLKIYRRQGDRMLIPLGQFKDMTPLRTPAPMPGRSISSSLQLYPFKEPPRHRTSLEKLGSLVFNLPIGVVVVDRRYDVQIINSLAHTLLGIHRSAMGEDVLHLAEAVPTKPLRAIIDAALRREAQVTMQVIPIEIETGEQRYLQVVGYPQQLEGDEGPIASVLLLVTDVTEAVRARHDVNDMQPTESLVTLAPLPSAIEAAPAEQSEDIQTLTNQVQRLMEANRELREANQELTATNLELHQANEEYLVNTEEVQAAAEEVETLNEELQATNEELETLNEELQATVEELNATNDDLEARSAEMHELAQTREQQHRISEVERAQLEAILVSMADAVLVLDHQGNVLRTNEAYLRMFGDPATPFVALDNDGQPLADEETPQHRTAKGEAFYSTFMVVGRNGDSRRFEATGHPLPTDGAGVLVIRDVTAREAH